MKKDLTKYDFVIAVDKSGSMTLPGSHGLSCWEEAKEAVSAIAVKAAEFDADGLTLVTFANTHTITDGVTPEKVSEVFSSQEPNGGTDTAAMLRAVFDRYNAAKAQGEAKPVILLVITDGAPNSKDAVKAEIKAFAETLTDNGSGDTDEFGILFIQIGDDAEATKFLIDLDDNLGAKFDIVDTKTADQLEGMKIADAFLAALED